MPKRLGKLEYMVSLFLHQLTELRYSRDYIYCAEIEAADQLQKLNTGLCFLLKRKICRNPRRLVKLSI